MAYDGAMAIAAADAGGVAGGDRIGSASGFAPDGRLAYPALDVRLASGAAMGIFASASETGDCARPVA